MFVLWGQWLLVFLLDPADLLGPSYVAVVMGCLRPLWSGAVPSLLVRGVKRPF